MSIASKSIANAIIASTSNASTSVASLSNKRAGEESVRATRASIVSASVAIGVL